MKKFKNGMVLGKFYPPTNGHLYLIDEALKQSEHVDVFVCGLKSEKIHGMVRTFWLWQHYQNKGITNINIIPINEELPQTPEEHGDVDDFYKIWCDVVHSKTSNLDAIFTSETYGEEFSQYLDLEHVMVDLERNVHPVSGTAVRSNPIENWEHIPNIVRPHYKKLITIMGPESTGKTSLTKQLTTHFNGDLIEEYGREYTDENPAKAMTSDDFLVIAYKHDEKIMNALHTGTRPLIFIDTEAITTKLFGEMYLGDDFEEEEIDAIINQQIDQINLVLVCNIDVPWVDDGTRDFPNKKDRERHLKKIITELINRNIPYKMISGDYDERFEMAKEYVNELLKK